MLLSQRRKRRRPCLTVSLSFHGVRSRAKLALLVRLCPCLLVLLAGRVAEKLDCFNDFVGNPAELLKVMNGEKVLVSAGSLLL